MRFGESVAILGALLIAAQVHAEPLTPVHQTRYSMGTMFDIVAYHPSRQEAEVAIAKALAEIVRLDQVMSNFKADSELSRLNREARNGFVKVDASLYDVIRTALDVSRLSEGRFDVTIAPVLRVWKRAQEEGRRPSDAEVGAARRCVGSDKVETSAPDRVRYLQPCVEIDLGGIGKGYAVERAIAILRSAGIQHALVNAGGSSIAAIGTLPEQSGWPVRLGAAPAGDSTGRRLLLRDESMSTSQQNRVPHASTAVGFGDIIDPRIGGPVLDNHSVSVVARSATIADALSTALLMYSIEEARTLLSHFPDASATWTFATGEHTHVP